MDNINGIEGEDIPSSDVEPMTEDNSVQLNNSDNTEESNFIIKTSIISHQASSTIPNIDINSIDSDINNSVVSTDADNVNIDAANSDINNAAVNLAATDSDVNNGVANLVTTDSDINNGSANLVTTDSDINNNAASSIPNNVGYDTFQLNFDIDEILKNTSVLNQTAYNHLLDDFDTGEISGFTDTIPITTLNRQTSNKKNKKKEKKKNKLPASIVFGISFAVFLVVATAIILLDGTDILEPVPTTSPSSIPTADVPMGLTPATEEIATPVPTEIAVHYDLPVIDNVKMSNIYASYSDNGNYKEVTYEDYVKTNFTRMKHSIDYYKSYSDFSSIEDVMEQYVDYINDWDLFGICYLTGYNNYSYSDSAQLEWNKLRGKVTSHGFHSFDDESMKVIYKITIEMEATGNTNLVVGENVRYVTLDSSSNRVRIDSMFIYNEDGSKYYPINFGLGFNEDYYKDILKDDNTPVWLNFEDTYNVDLDGDNHDEVVSFSLYFDEDNVDVNNDQPPHVLDAVVNDKTINIGSHSIAHFASAFFVDIDKTDNYIELAVISNEMGIPYVEFFRYIDDTLTPFASSNYNMLSTDSKLNLEAIKGNGIVIIPDYIYKGSIRYVYDKTTNALTPISEWHYPNAFKIGKANAEFIAYEYPDTNSKPFIVHNNDNEYFRLLAYNDEWAWFLVGNNTYGYIPINNIKLTGGEVANLFTDGYTLFDTSFALPYNYFYMNIFN